MNEKKEVKEEKKLSFDALNGEAGNVFLLNNVDESEGVFVIRAIPDGIQKKIEKESRTKRPKGANALEFHDSEKMTRKRIAFALIDFYNVPKETILDMLEPDSHSQYFQQLKEEKGAVKISGFWKTQFINNYGSDFLSFFNEKLESIEEAKRQFLKDELKN